MSTVALDPSTFDALLATITRLDRILVATDFDGTLAPIGADPDAVRPVAGAEQALASLALLDRTTVAVISGRNFEDLDRRLVVPGDVVVLGSYGAEARSVSPVILSPSERRRWREIVVAFERLALTYAGGRVEYKTFGAAFHVRTARDPVAAAAAAMAAGAKIEGTHTMTGKMVVETSVRELSKAAAIARLRAEVDPYAVVYLGDDEADEVVFATLQPRDLGIRVGQEHPGSAAMVSVDDPSAAVSVIERLAALRAHHLRR